MTDAAITDPARRADPPPSARVIGSDEEALAVARDLAAEFALEASARDRERRLPWQEIECLSQAGLWGITVPREFGGAAVSHVTLAEVTAIIAEADPSIGQIPQNHYCLVDAVRLIGTPEQQTFFFAEALAGKRLGNAVSERGNKDRRDLQTRLSRTSEGLRLNGKKFYSTGALFAHWVPVAAKDDDGLGVLVYVHRDAPGLTVEDDWDGIGQRTTASGTVIADNVAVESWQVLPRHRLFEPATIHGSFAQLLHAAIDLGIARAALADLRLWVRERARPWGDSNQAEASQDPLTLTRIGDLLIRLHGAEALLERAARVIDRARAASTDASVSDASIATAEARVVTTEVALETSTVLFELAGTQAALSEHNLDRHWRNARTHTLHDPVRWKPHAIGNFWLNGIHPPRHGSL
jgi:SfnB family sulfur acquisition oxidoreductase